MPKVEVRVPSGLESFHSDARPILVQRIKMQSIELACEQLMGMSRRDMSADELKSALEAYRELRDTVEDQTEMLDRVQLMLKVVGQNLMGSYETSSST